MRKLTAFCLTVVLLILVFSNFVVFGDDSDLYIESYSPQTIVNDVTKSFSFSMRIKNTSGRTITDLKAEIDVDNSAYFPSNDSDKVKVVATNLGDNTLSDNYSVQLRYKGSGTALKFIFTYKYEEGVDEQRAERTINIPATEPPNNTDNPIFNIDPSKIIPVLGTVEGNEMPTIKAGGQATVTFPVKNSGGHQARDITITLGMVDESKAPLVLDNLDLRKYVDTINGGQTKDVTFTIKTLRSAPEGIYAMRLNYSYVNAFDYSFSSSETVYIKIENDYVNPRLLVESIKMHKNDTTDSAIGLELVIRNLGNLPAKEIKVTLNGLKTGGFTASNSTNIKHITEISGKSAGAVIYQLLMPKEMLPGSNELFVKMDYRDDAGNNYSEENQIFVPVGEAVSAKPALTVSGISAPKSAVNAYNDFVVSFDIKNNGDSAARNIKVSLATDAQIVSKTMNPVYIDKVEAGSNKTASFTLFATDDAVTKNYPIAINVEYEDAYGTKFNAAQYIGVFVENSAQGKSVPRIIIDNYTIEPDTVRASDDFLLKLSFLNTSKTADVSNIKVTVISEDGTFTPTDSGNTFFIESIQSKQNVRRELMLNVKPDAEQKSYMLSINFEYEDNAGNQYTSRESVSIRVLQNPRLVTGEMSIMPETFVGQPVPIYIDFYNMGKSTLYNMMVRAEGEFEGQNLSYYVGNFEPGRTDYFDASIIPMVPGQVTGAVVFSFEDANGKITEVRKEFSLNVMEMMMEGPIFDENGMPIEPGMEMGGEMGGSKPSVWIYIGIGAAVIAAGVVTTVLLRKRHLRRKELSLDE